MGQIWEISDAKAVCLSVTNARHGPGTYFEAENGEDIFDAIRRQASGFFPPSGENPFTRLELDPNHFYPRMARRPSNVGSNAFGFYPGYENDRDLIAISKSQLLVLTDMLGSICQTVHPVEQNLGVFGHDIRNLLILAATEFEAQCRGVLTANGAVARNTADYVKLLRPMRLKDYKIAFTKFGWLDPIAPFESWEPSAPTQSLAWYDAYSATKHDREVNFSAATLRHCLSAMAGIVALLIAQFGGRALGYGAEAFGQEREMSFRIAAWPSWEPGEVYTTVPAFGGAWTPVSFPFIG
jgi:hypothetical protein